MKRISSIATLGCVLLALFLFVSCDDNDSSTNGGTSAPTVVSTNPAGGAVDVPVDTAISVTFSEDMNPSTVAGSTFQIDDGAVSGSVTYADRKATFTPSADLSWGTMYTAKVTTGVMDLDGTALAADYEWTFTTEAPAGLVWSTRTGPGVVLTLNDVCWCGSQFVAVGEMGTIITSPDGAAWTSRTSPSSDNLGGVAWSGTTCVTIGADGTIMTSADGIAWVEQTSPLPLHSSLSGVTWSETHSQFVVVGNSGVILTSPDGVAWTARISGVSCDLRAVAWSGSRYAAIASSLNSGCQIALVSDDGITWVERPLLYVEGVNDICWSGTQFIVAGWAGQVFSSPDGMDWTRIESAGSYTESLYSVAWSGALSVAVGHGGRIVTSYDGITWTGQSSPTASLLSGVCWSGDRFVAVGSGGVIVTSP